MPRQFLGFLAIILIAPALWADGERARELTARNRTAESAHLQRRITSGFRLSPLNTVREINGILLSSEHDLKFPNLLDEFLRTVATPDGKDLVKMRFVYKNLIDQYFESRREIVRSGQIYDLETLRQLDHLISDLITMDIRRLSKNRETQDLLFLDSIFL